LQNKIPPTGALRHAHENGHPSITSLSVIGIQPSWIPTYAGMTGGGMFLPRKRLRITYEIKPEIFAEKRGNAALLSKNFGFYFQSLDELS